MKKYIVVSAVGKDRPGFVNRITHAISELVPFSGPASGTMKFGFAPPSTARFLSYLSLLHADPNTVLKLVDVPTRRKTRSGNYLVRHGCQ